MKRIIIFCGILAGMLTCSAPGRGAELPVSSFTTEGLAGWEPQKFKSVTEYRIIKENGRSVVKAVSNASASGLVKKIRFSPATYRYLRWSWKVAHTVRDGDEKTRAGDDYAARVYVLFPGTFFWQMKAINYIWANKLVKGESVPNAYTANAKMIAVESGNEKAGQWLMEERDLRADYLALFGTEPPEAAAVAIMTDTDNTGGTAEAWYGEIVLSSEGK